MTPCVLRTAPPRPADPRGPAPPRCRQPAATRHPLSRPPAALRSSTQQQQALVPAASAPAAAATPAPATGAALCGGRRQALLSGAAAAVLGGLGALAGALSRVPAAEAAAPAAAEGAKDVQLTASGIRVSLVSAGRGEAPAPGTLVLVDVVGTLEDGSVFLDTRAPGAAPLAFQLGSTNILVPQGLAQVVATMRSRDVTLAEVPPALGYGARGVAFKSGRRVPPNAKLFYEVNLLRCQSMTMGLACCTDADFPCIKKQPAAAAEAKP